MRRILAALLALVVVLATLGGCGGKTEPTPPGQPGTDFAAMMRQRVSVDAMMTHLAKLQQIADANRGTRAIGTPGFEASVDYVVETLQAKGFDVQTPELEVRLAFADDPVLTVGAQTIEAKPLEYTIGTPPGGVNGPLVAARVEDSPGCTAADYDRLPMEGSVVLVDRGQCPCSTKQAAAAEQGAGALIVANNVDGVQSGATLGENTDVTIPVIGVSKSDGALLREQPGAYTTLNLIAGVRVQQTRNVIAQTRTGSMTDVVMVGAHLDSAPSGPGINDNGSGVAAVLESALQMGSSPPVNNAVRFGFWAAEEQGLIGSVNYVRSLDVNALKDIALYLNVDMLGSPNPGYFTYDGDQSAPPDPDRGPPRVPEGSAGIERTLVAYLNGVGKTPQDTPLDGQLDYGGFIMAGIPAGGIFSGAEAPMSAEQAELWGGTVQAPFDPNYHKETDAIGKVNRSALEINGQGIAYAIGLYAQDVGGRNGVPVREDRDRHVLAST